MGLAIVILILMALLVPLLLLVSVRTTQRQRETSLGLRGSEVEHMFDDLDKDHSGQLESSELKELMNRMSTGQYDRSIDDDGNGVVNKREFMQWHQAQLSTLVRSPIDILFATTRSTAYGWFLHDIWLKLAVNVVFNFGFHGDHEWHIWMLILLASSVAFIIKEMPFLNAVDSRAWVYSLLSLACVTHLNSLFRHGEQWPNGFLVITTLLFIGPILGMVRPTVCSQQPRL